MTLKTATLLALLGTSLKFVWSLSMLIKSFQIGTKSPLVYSLASLPAMLFEAGLVLFFLTLLRKQKNTGDGK
jgi:hypothetical protein